MMRTWLVGAGPEADVQLGKSGVSGRHAEIALRDKQWWLRDIGSTNGTWIDGQRVGADWHPLATSAAVQFGRSVSCTGGQLLERLADPPLAVALSVGGDAACDVCVDHPQVSGLHLLVLVAGQRWVVVDQRARNGTWLADVQVGRAEWPAGVTLRLGPVVLDRSLVARQVETLTRKAATVSGQWCLGAGDDCPLQVPLPSVSSRHAELQCRNGSWQVRDLGSSNGTWVGAERVGADWYPLPADAVLRVGAVEIPMQRLAMAALRRPQVTADDAGPAQSAQAAAGGGVHKRAEPLLPSPVAAAEAVDQALPTRSAPAVSGAPPASSAGVDGARSGNAGTGRWLSVMAVLAVVAAGVVWQGQRRAAGGGGIAPAPAPGPAPAPDPAPTPGPAPAPDPAPAPGPAPSPTPPPPDRNADWQPAWPSLRSAARPAAAPHESETAMATFGKAPHGTEGLALPPDQADLLLESSALRAQHDANAYHGVNMAQLGDARLDNEAYTVQSTSLDADLLVPHLDDLPIRNQQARGTCAAFTAIGGIEQAALLRNPALRTLDLSEQRFYWTSKPTCQDDGCPGGSEGSNYHTGLRASTSASRPDIPLERDCPYNGQPSSNDTHVPQPATCQRGSVRVASTRSLSTLQQVVDVLSREKRAVLVASTLSDNYMEPPPSGIIAVADDASRQRNQHTDGHAYLLVGYKRLPDRQDEGGVCFVIRNSWGRTWGRNGYACATQAWLKAHDVQSLAVVTDVEFGGELGPPTPPPAPPTPAVRNLTVKSPMGGWVDAQWRAQGQSGDLRFYLTAGGLSQALRLEVDGVHLSLQGKLVGEVDNSGSATLCSGRYTRACMLEINLPQKQLRIVRRDGQPQREASLATTAAAPPSLPWIPLLQLPDGRRVELQGDVEHAMLRCRIQGQDAATGVLDLELRGSGVWAGGRQIGSLDAPPALCTGPYAQACGFVAGGDGLDVVIWP